MTPSALDIGAILVLILPGFLSYRAALARRADPARRSTLWQLAEILEYSVYVHLLGAALVFGTSAILARVFQMQLHLRELFSMRPHDFIALHFVEGSLFFTLYPLYVVIASVILGAYSLPHWTSARIVRAFGSVVRRIGSIPGMRWIHPPSPNFPEEPIWYEAFNIATDGFTRSRPLVLVKMKRGDIYYGALASYPILPDSQRAKDFLIVDATYAPSGGGSYDLSAGAGGGTVLLNSADVDSIQVYYEPIDDLQQ